MSLKNFIIFAYDDYYPEGGLNDIETSFDTYEEAYKFFKKSRYANNQIVNRDTWEILKED